MVRRFQHNFVAVWGKAKTAPEQDKYMQAAPNCLPIAVSPMKVGKTKIKK